MVTVTVCRRLGQDIWGWSLPVGDTCPGASEVCLKMCYGKRGCYRFSTVDAALIRNFDASRTPEFVPWMIQEIRNFDIRMLRVHVTGDYYGLRYIRDWSVIMKKCKRVKFYSYTRSWTQKPLLASLVELGRLPNCAMWFSWDAAMPFPPKRKGIRTCYLSQDDNDFPSRTTDLVFRDNPTSAIKHDPKGNWICAKENGATVTNCSRCGVCWTKEVLNGTKNLKRRRTKSAQESGTRRSLRLV